MRLKQTDFTSQKLPNSLPKFPKDNLLNLEWQPKIDFNYHLHTKNEYSQQFLVKNTHFGCPCQARTDDTRINSCPKVSNLSPFKRK